MNLIENLKLAFKNGNSLIKLIFVNVAIFVFINIFLITLKLFKLDGFEYFNWFAVSSNFTELLHHFWTPLSYMFLHQKLMHLLFNMLALFWFGKIFLMYYTEKQFIALYFFGGIVGAIIFVLAYHLFPFYSDIKNTGILLGASGSIMAVVMASAVKAPNFEMQLLFIGKIKIIYIALVTVLISILGVTGENGGGEMAHLGGAFAGYIFVLLEKNGRDIITPFFNKMIDFFVNLFHKNGTKFKTTTYHSAKMTDDNFNQKKAANEIEINKILDKIKSSGYESLTTDEKQKLFEQKR